MADQAQGSDKAASPATKVAEPPSESEIDSPRPVTLALLGVIFLVTAGSWGAARFACNMHPPESRSAPKLPTERLALTPKDAAIEFIQRLRSSDYEGALEVSAQNAAAEVMKLKAECAANANECARSREAAAGRLTVAKVMKQDGLRADARVSTMLKGTTEKYRLTLARDNAVWKVVEKAPD